MTKTTKTTKGPTAADVLHGMLQREAATREVASANATDCYWQSARDAAEGHPADDNELADLVAAIGVLGIGRQQFVDDVRALERLAVLNTAQTVADAKREADELRDQATPIGVRREFLRATCRSLRGYARDLARSGHGTEVLDRAERDAETVEQLHAQWRELTDRAFALERDAAANAGERTRVIAALRTRGCPADLLPSDAQEVQK